METKSSDFFRKVHFSGDKKQNKSICETEWKEKAAAAAQPL